MDYYHRNITSLIELKPGDHIVVDTSTANPDDKTSGKEGPHHMLVVEVMDYKHAKVIHSVAKVQYGVKEERQRILPHHVTVLDYVSQYTGEAAIRRARKMLSENMNGQKAWRKSESFVSEARTGEKKSSPGTAGLAAGLLLPFGLGGVIDISIRAAMEALARQGTISHMQIISYTCVELPDNGCIFIFLHHGIRGRGGGGGGGA